MRRFLPSRFGKIVLVLAVLLAACRVALPFVVRGYVVRTLNAGGEYDASIRDLDISLWRGAYSIEGITIDKRDKQGRTPFLYIERLEIALDGRSLLHGRILAATRLESPVVNFEIAKETRETQVGTGVAWQDRLADLAPVDIQRFVVAGGFVHFLDATRDPKIDVFAMAIAVEAKNLKNRSEYGASDPATLHVSARTVGNGEVRGSMRWDPLATPPRFDLDLAIEQLDLTRLNDLFRALGDFDFEKGRADVYVELAADRGRIHGYVKPLLHDLDVLDWKHEEKGEGVTGKLWEGVVGGLSQIFKNQPRDRLGARIFVEGDISDPRIGVFEIVLSVLRNAFVRALSPGIDDEIGSASDPVSIAEQLR